MRIGMIGLGKMGSALSMNMIEQGIEVLGTDKTIKSHETIETTYDIESLVEKLKKPRVIWMMVPAGGVTETLVTQLKDLLDTGDILMDGGNSHFKDSKRRYEFLKDKGIHYIDIGTAGGVTGARNGTCLMVGGDKAPVEQVRPVFETITCDNGFSHVGASGAGHYAKMVHNGIEYGMMQAIAEGFDLMDASQYDFDAHAVAKVFNSGSYLEGYLMETIMNVFEKDRKLRGIKGKVDTSGEGEWTVNEAIEKKVSTPVITAALYTRFKSKDAGYFSEKIIAAMRREFGGHRVYKK